MITAPDAEWLATFTRELVDDRLCAAGHHVAEIRSVYRWRGDIHDRSEARVALHTRVELVPEIVARADRSHPYEVPCVVVTPIKGGNPAYLRWIVEETRTAG
ncbi:MAG: divalent-cation tolerance protein CutA [Micromonosporaceae bacterium]